MPSPADDLAALRDGDPADRKPYRLKLDTGLTLEAPSARRLAEVYAFPALATSYELHRSGAALLARVPGDDAEPTAVPLAALAERVRAAVAALPDDPAAGRPYRDARHLAAEAAEDTAAAYFVAVARAVVRLAPPWRPPAASADRGPAMTAAQRKALSRDRERAAELASVREWLDLWLEEDAPAPGSRVCAAELFETCLEALTDLAEDGELLADEETPIRPPRRRAFYAAADELLGPRRRHGRADVLVYTLPTR